MLDVLLLCYLKHAHRVEMLAPPIVVHRRINIVNTIMIASTELKVTQVGQGELLLDLLLIYGV